MKGYSIFMIKSPYEFGGVNTEDRLPYMPPEVTRAVDEASRAATPEGVRARSSDTRAAYLEISHGINDTPYAGRVITVNGIDPALHEALSRKVSEYYDRFDEGRQTEKCDELFPTDALRSVMHSTYKLIAMELLLSEGSLDVARLEAALVSTGPYEATEFDSAITLTERYAYYGGAGIDGGTGLQEQ